MITHVICRCSRFCCPKMSRSDSHCSHFLISRVLRHPRLMDGLSFLRFRNGAFFNPAKHFHPFSVPKLAEHHIKECAGRPTHERRERNRKTFLHSLHHHFTQHGSLPARLTRGSTQQLHSEGTRQCCRVIHY